MDNPFKGLSQGEKIAVAAGAVLVTWFAWKQHQSSGAGSSSAIDPLTGLPASQDNATDPLTGEAYLAEAQQYGSVTAAEQSLSGTGLGASYYGYPSGLAGTSTGASLVPQNVVQGTTYGSNSAWAQAVEAGLTDIGYSPTDVAAALGRYLGDLPETAAQAGIVQAAIAEYGLPPVGSFTIRQAPPAGPAGSGNTATTPAQVGSFSVTPYKGYANFGWHAVAGADNYELKISGPQSIDRQTGNVLNQHVTLKPGHYTAQVRANNHGKLGPWSAARPFTVT